MDDTPGTLGKVCRALADRNVNILGLHSFPIGEKAVTRFAVDNPTAAKTAFDSERVSCAQAEVAQVKLPHRPGEIARVATRLGESKVNINYAYCGLEPGANTPLIFFGVADAGQAAPILDLAAPRPRSLRTPENSPTFLRGAAHTRSQLFVNGFRQLTAIYFCERTSLGKKEK